MTNDDPWWRSFPEPGPWEPVAGFRKPPRWDGARPHGWFGTFDCLGCRRTVPTNCPADRLCQDCRCDLYELIAKAASPALAAKAEVDGCELWPVLNAVYADRWDRYRGALIAALSKNRR